MNIDDNDTNPTRDALLRTYDSELKTIKKKAENIVLSVDAEEDYERARKNLHELIDVSSESLAVAASLARDSEHPRAFEVLANMIATASQLSDQLLRLQKHRHDLSRQNEDSSDKSGTTNNNIFIGSTAELQRLLNNKRDEKAITIEDNEDSITQ